MYRQILSQEQFQSYRWALLQMEQRQWRLWLLSLFLLFRHLLSLFQHWYQNYRCQSLGFLFLVSQRIWGHCWGVCCPLPRRRPPNYRDLVYTDSPWNAVRTGADADWYCCPVASFSIRHHSLRIVSAGRTPFSYPHHCYFLEPSPLRSPRESRTCPGEATSASSSTSAAPSSLLPFLRGPHRIGAGLVHHPPPLGWSYWGIDVLVPRARRDPPLPWPPGAGAASLSDVAPGHRSARPAALLLGQRGA